MFDGKKHPWFNHQLVVVAFNILSSMLLLKMYVLSDGFFHFPVSQPLKNPAISLETSCVFFVVQDRMICYRFFA